MPIQTKSTQAREKRKLIRSSIFFCDSFFWVCVCFVISFQLCGWISPDGSVSEPHSDKERSKAAWVWFGHSRTAVLGRTTAGGDGGVLGETWEWAVAVIRYWLSPDSHSLAHPQCAANVAFFKLKFDQLIERRWRVCRAESRQNLQREAKYIHWKRLHVHKLLRLCLSTNMTSLKWKVLITLCYGDFEMCRCCCRSDIQHSWKLMGFSKWTHLLKYSTSLSVSSISVLSRSMSLGRKTSSMARQAGTCYVMLFLSFIVNDNAKNNKCKHLFGVNPFS